mgnify:FL=1
MGIFQKIIEGFRPSMTAEEENAVRSKIAEFDLAVHRMTGRYISLEEIDAFKGSWNQTYKEIKATRIPKNSTVFPIAQQFFQSYDHLSGTITAMNESFLDMKSRKCDALLSDIDGKSLDRQQRIVVLSDEPRTLVLAGAGSGKTLTIAGKVKYLCQECGVPPEDILLIAFTKKSAEEMTERIAGKLDIPVQATTFHKLGLDIITAAEGKRPEVQDNLTDFVRNYFENEIASHPDLVKQLIEFFAYYLHIPADMEKFDSLGAAYEYEKSVDFETLRSKYDQAQWVNQASDDRKEQRRTLKDERVKSLEEVSIANFLFLNGVNYEYERLYPFESDDPTRKAYRPDFYLPDYDLYLEHFGISKDGHLPWLTKIEEQKYLDDMAWKRETHKSHGTKLLETYSYLSSEGKLLDYLDSLLRKNGVEYHEPNFQDIFEKVYEKESDRYFSEFISLCCTFISLFKSKGYQPGDLLSLYSGDGLFQRLFFRKRTELFKQILLPLLIAYEGNLRENGAIDFADMINRATELVTGGFRVHPYQYIIIDEYQDISFARYKLVKAILDQTGAKLLCVGDDWQSIYRFAGSDITLFTHFQDYFGSSAILRLEQTYRNAQQLIDEAGKFVMRNPEQLRKTLRSPKMLDYPITFMCYETTPFPTLRRIMDKIIAGFGPQASIMLLGRTNFDLELVAESGLFQISKNGNINYLASPETPIRFLTVHKAKGLEADNVVLLNFQNATLGFPNKIADDPMLRLVLTAPEDHPYAEERRLLYVAMTRTRNRVFVLTDSKKPSEFFKEFSPSKSVFILAKGNTTEEQVKCPRCKTGTLLVRKNDGSNKYFVGCSNYPQCDYTVQDTSILTTQRICPDCGGFLIKRRGKFGQFYGCTNYPACQHTEQITNIRHIP